MSQRSRHSSIRAVLAVSGARPAAKMTVGIHASPVDQIGQVAMRESTCSHEHRGSRRDRPLRRSDRRRRHRRVHLGSRERRAGGQGRPSTAQNPPANETRAIIPTSAREGQLTRSLRRSGPWWRCRLRFRLPQQRLSVLACRIQRGGEQHPCRPRGDVFLRRLRIARGMSRRTINTSQLGRVEFDGEVALLVRRRKGEPAHLHGIGAQAVGRFVAIAAMCCPFSPAGGQGAGVRPWRRITAARAAWSGGPPAAASRMAAISWK